MTTPDVLLAEVVAERPLTHLEARALVDSIRTDVADVGKRIEVAYLGQSWIALGYGSWDALCEAEFSGARLRIPREDRAEQVQSLRSTGLSTRSIASALGVSKDTVARDLSGVASETPDSSIVGQDGKRYAPTRPRTSPASAPAAATAAQPASTDAGEAATPEEFLAQREPGNVLSPEDWQAQPEPNPLAAARAEVARQPAMVATAGIDYLRKARKAFEAAGTSAAIVADLDNDNLVDRTGDWLHELDATLPLLNDLTTRLRRRNLRSVKP